MSRESGNTFLAFLAGAAVGAVVGILYAPDKGKNTRDKLSFQLDKYKVKLQQLIDEMIEGKDETSTVAKTRQDQVTKDTISKAEKIMGEISALQQTISKDQKK